MRTKPTANAPTRPPALPPGNSCECAGCRFHIARLEAFNRQLAIENDRLTTENANLRRTSQETERAA